MRWVPLLLLSISLGYAANCSPRSGFAKCFNATQQFSQNGATDSANFPVGTFGVANGGSGTLAFASSKADLRTAGNGGLVQNTIAAGGILQAAYVSGGTPTCTNGQTVKFNTFSGSLAGATATATCNGVNTITVGPVTINTPGSGAIASGTMTANCVNGTGTCTGVATLTVHISFFAVPADFACTSDAAGTTLIPFTWDHYTASTGDSGFYALVSISHTVNTAFYCSYDNASQTTFLGNVETTWNSGYQHVDHYENILTSAGHITESDEDTVNFLTNSLSDTGSGCTQITGVIGHGFANSGTDRMETLVNTANFPVGSAARTFEVWINNSGSKFANGVNFGQRSGVCNVANQCWGWYGSDNTYGVRNTWVGLLFSNDLLPSTDFPQDSNWHHLVTVFPSGQTQCSQGLLYLDGAVLSQTCTTPTAVVNTGNGAQTHYAVGGDSQNSSTLLSHYDESRVSNVARSADYILATYNNFHAPGSFVVVSDPPASNMPPAIF